MPNDTTKKLVFIFEDCPTKGSYPLERLLILYNMLPEHDRFLFVKTKRQPLLKLCEKYNVMPILFDNFDEAARSIRNLQADVIIQDGKNQLSEYTEKLKPFCKTYIQFDNFLDGHMLADYNLFTFVDELLELNAPNSLIGSYSFAVPDDLLKIPKDKPKNSITPHIVIHFEDGDPQNLTYRVLRHLTQLHIPLKLSIVIDEDYKHSIDDLQMMQLQCNAKMIKFPTDAKYLEDSTIVIGNANYTPFKIASVGIPYIALAQNELELGNSVVREENGFIHLGLGKKIKQSSLQNAVMELILHDDRRERAIVKQQRLAIVQNNELLQTLISKFISSQPITFL